MPSGLISSAFFAESLSVLIVLTVILGMVVSVCVRRQVRGR